MGKWFRVRDIGIALCLIAAFHMLNALINTVIYRQAFFLNLLCSNLSIDQKAVYLLQLFIIVSFLLFISYRSFRFTDKSDRHDFSIRGDRDIRLTLFYVEVLFSKLSDGVLIVGCSDRKIKMVNDAACELLGYKKNDITNMDMNTIQSGNLPENTIFDVDGKWERREDVLFRRNDKTLVMADINFSRVCIRDNGKDIPSILVILDTSEADRKEDLVSFLSVVAHKVNNHIMDISGNVQLAMMDDSLSGETRAYLEKIYKQSKRENILVSHLAGLFNMKSECMTKGYIKDAINESIEGNNNRNSTKNITIIQDTGSSIPDTYVYVEIIDEILSIGE